MIFPEKRNNRIKIIELKYLIAALIVFLCACVSNHEIRPPYAPTILQASNSTNAVTLSWDGVHNVAYYQIYFSDIADGPFTIAGETSTTSYRVGGLINGNTYFFTVKAVNSRGESPLSNVVSAVPNTLIISRYVVKSAVYKGQLHDHTINSDGQHTPDQVAEAYKNAGYDFLAITDHIYVTTPANNRGLLLINGVEETANEGHIITVNPPSQVNSYDGQTIIDNARNNGGLAILAHPNYISAGYTIDELNALTGYTAIDIYNRVVDYSEGHGNAEDKGDAILSQGKIVYGVAVDDMQGKSKNNARC